jgi:two-component system sensor histidine kinase HydH
VRVIPAGKRSWTGWVSFASVAMALFAVFSLGATVLVAQHALSDASDVIARGEGDALLANVIGDISEEGAPASAALLERALADHRTDGLRYVALFDREAKQPLFAAGTQELPNVFPKAGEASITRGRARITGPLMGRRGMRSGGFRERSFPGIPLLVVLEFEPPVVANLRRDLQRIALVGAGASAVLLAFAIALSRTARRLAMVEQRAAREQRLVALGTMSSVMAHELRNPLASLKGHAQLLVEDLAEGKPRAKAERVVAEAERLESLTTNLLDFVRDGPMDRVRITPAELVETAIADLDAKRIKTELNGAPPALVVDRLRLTRALHNLVDNALQAGPEHPVDVTVAQRGRETEISVRDRGPGLPPGETDQLFEPFMTTRVRGTGLGLPLARRIAEQHGGTLTAENHPEGGAVFRLRLPDLELS